MRARRIVINAAPFIVERGAVIRFRPAERDIQHRAAKMVPAKIVGSGYRCHGACRGACHGAGHVLAKLAAIRRPESLLATFIKVCLRTDCTMDMRAPVTVATCGHSKALE